MVLALSGRDERRDKQRVVGAGVGDAGVDI
jgi:hypothetical protein